VLWAEGEGLILAGPPGVGKTTLAGQLMAGRAGILHSVIGMPVTPAAGRVLYLAMDRPRQIQRAFGRLIRPGHRDLLNKRLRIRPGPPPRDLAKHPEVLTYLAHAVKADTVFIDSLKDAAIGLSDDEVGAGLNRALQTAVAEGVETLSLHHQRKGQGGTKPKTLEDLYGSTWISAGAGSVVLLWGQPGDAIVELVHLKQPGSPVGPLKIEHDHATGLSIVHRGFDLLAYLRNQKAPVEAGRVARARYDKDPTENQIRIVRRSLDRLVAKGLAIKLEAIEGGTGGTTPARWAAVDTHREMPQ
jgi:hypothetical protein